MEDLTADNLHAIVLTRTTCNARDTDAVVIHRGDNPRHMGTVRAPRVVALAATARKVLAQLIDNIVRQIGMVELDALVDHANDHIRVSRGLFTHSFGYRAFDGRYHTNRAV